MSSIPTESAEYGTFSTSSSIPTCLLHDKVVIAGGGPAGLLAAISLHTVGVPNITVLERENYDSSFDLQRSYVFALGARSRTATSKIPGLLEHLLQFTPAPNGYKTGQLDASVPGSLSVTPSMRTLFLKNFIPGTLFFRPRLMMALLQFIREHCSDVEVISNATVEDVTFSKENGGMSTVRYIHHNADDDNAEECFIDANLLIACDGVNSAVVNSLKVADPSLVQSPHGFEATFFDTQASNRKGRSLIVGEAIFDDVENAPDDITSKYWIFFEGTNKKVGSFMLPLLKEDCDDIGGLLVTVIADNDDPLWKLQSIEEGYRYFEKQYPALDIRANVTEHAMKNFLFGRIVKFPVIRQRHSMGARVGDVGGVIVLGDAAHAVPPDIGQGLNCSIEDVDAMVTGATELASDASHGDLAYLFHEKRIDHSRALAKLAVYGSITNKPKWMLPIFFYDVTMRNALYDRFPKLFDPPFQSLLSRSVPYAEVVRRQRVMTVKMFVINLFIGALIVICVTRLLTLLPWAVGGVLSLFREGV